MPQVPPLARRSDRSLRRVCRSLRDPTRQGHPWSYGASPMRNLRVHLAIVVAIAIAIAIGSPGGCVLPTTDRDEVIA
jgi:hypothetical protein